MEQSLEEKKREALQKLEEVKKAEAEQKQHEEYAQQAAEILGAAEPKTEAFDGFMNASKEEIIKDQQEREQKPMNETNALAVGEFNLPVMNDEMSKLYENHLGAGTEDWMGESFPKLQLITGNNISNIPELAGGLAPKLGSYLYTGEMTMYETVDVVLCKSSAGFYTKNTKWKKEGDKLANYNIIVGGFIADSLLPFQMYISGGRASRWFEFQDLIRPLTKGKQYKFPLYAFKVRLGMYKQRNNDYDKMDYFYTFELVKNELGQVVMENDQLSLDMYKRMHDKLEDIISSYRDKYETDKQGKLINGYIRSAEVVDTNDEPY